MQSNKIDSQPYSAENLQKLLRDYYGQQLTIKRLFYPEQPIPIERHYNDLTMTSQQDYEKRLKSLQNLRPGENRDESHETYNNLYGQTSLTIINELLIKDITCLSREGTVPDSTKIAGSHHMLMTGTPGIGKSTLTEYLCHSWGDKKGYNDYHWVLRIPLRNLIEERYPKNKGCNVFDIMVKECFGSLINRLLTKSELADLKEKITLTEDRNCLLVILDGFDEIQEQLAEHFKLPLKDLFSFRRIILMSRPYNLHSLESYGFRSTTVLEITEFPPQSIATYVNKFFKIILCYKFIE